MQMSNMSGVDVRGFGNKLCKIYVRYHVVGVHKKLTHRHTWKWKTCSTFHVL